MTKYFIFIIVFFLSFTINISVSRGETEDEAMGSRLDVYYKKTLIFRGWENKDSKISEIEKKLLSLTRGEKIEKKEVRISSGPGDKLFANLIQGRVILVPPKAKDKILQMPVADAILLFPYKIVKKSDKKKQVAALPEKENSNLIFGSNAVKDCLLGKKYCSFDITAKVKRYSDKLAPKTEKIDSSKFPIDF